MIKVGRLLLGLVSSGLCLWYILNRVLGDASTSIIIERIGGLSLMWGFLAFASLLLSYPLNTLRLKYILLFDEVCTCNFKQILSIVWGSSFLSLAMPSAAFSDGIRVALLRALKISNISLAVRAVLIDRAMGLIYMLALAGLLLLILPDNFNLGISRYWSLIFLLGFFCATAMIFLGSTLANKIQLFMRLRNLLNSMRRLMSAPKTVILFLVFALVNVTISALSIWCITRGFSMDISFWVFYLLTPAILIVNNLPIFYQGFGGREAVILFAFSNSQSGMTPDLILSISLVSGAVLIVSAIIGSVFVPFLFERRS